MESVPACRILLIADDPQIAWAIEEGLGRRGFAVWHAGNLTSARKMIDGHNTDVVVVDLPLPDGYPSDFAAALQRNRGTVGVLLLTAPDATDDRVAASRRGADDYLCKPFGMTELATRLRAIQRRKHTAERPLIAYADIELNLATRTVRRGDIEASLSAREGELLAYLIRHKEEPLSRARILRDVWGSRADKGSNVLNVYINYLRSKIDFRAEARMIHTVRGVGYILARQAPEPFTA